MKLHRAWSDRHPQVFFPTETFIFLTVWRIFTMWHHIGVIAKNLMGEKEKKITAKSFQMIKKNKRFVRVLRVCVYRHENSCVKSFCVRVCVWHACVILALCVCVCVRGSCLSLGSRVIWCDAPEMHRQINSLIDTADTSQWLCRMNNWSVFHCLPALSPSFLLPSSSSSVISEADHSPAASSVDLSLLLSFFPSIKRSSSFGLLIYILHML